MKNKEEDCNIWKRRVMDVVGPKVADYSFEKDRWEVFIRIEAISIVTAGFLAVLFSKLEEHDREEAAELWWTFADGFDKSCKQFAAMIQARLDGGDGR
jgi:hypothetical protein